MLDRIFGSRDNGFDFNNPRQSFAGHKDDPDDCLSCRALGSGALVGMGIYTYHTGMQNLKARRSIIEASTSRYKYGSRQLGILMLALPMVGAGFYRAFN